MGGEREDHVTSKSSIESQGSISGVNDQKLRFHENAGQVHFHDDVLKLKAAIPVAEWWKAWEKLRTTPSHWTWFDSQNDTILTVQTTILSGEPSGVEVNIRLAHGAFGSNFKALNAFTKK